MKFLRSKYLDIITHCFEIQDVLRIYFFQNTAIPDEHKFFVPYLHFFLGAFHRFLHAVNGFQKTPWLDRFYEVINNIQFKSIDSVILLGSSKNNERTLWTQVFCKF